MPDDPTPTAPALERNRTRARSLLILVLGLWIGGSVVVGAVVSYNLTGFADLFARNPALAQQAGFDPAAEAEKKESLLWVQSSELNRVFFERWNQTQLVLGALALALALVAGLHRLQLWLLLGAMVLALGLHLEVEPRVVELGRALDFVPRSPPPPELAAFQRMHGIYFAAESVRFALVLLCAAMLVFGGRRG